MHRTSLDAPHRPPMLRRAAGRIAAVLTVSLLALTGVQALTQQSAAAVGALSCDQSTIYGIDNSGVMQAITVANGTTSPVTTMTHNTNALGVTDGGSHAYAFSSGKATGANANTLDDYVAATNSVRPFTGIDSSAAAIRGAVNPQNGFFYYAVNTPANTGPSTTYLGAYDPATDTRYGQVAAIQVASSGNGGDMAFSRTGVLYFLTGNTIYRVDDPVPAASGQTVLHSTLVTSISGFTSSPGMAFAANGYLYASSGSSLKKIDPASGMVTDTQTIAGSYSPNDLAGCNYPDSFSAGVVVPDRLHDSDQWTVTLSGGSTWSAATKTATTSGTATGVQPQSAGPVLAVGGNTYTATETMASGNASDYDTTWSCAAGGTVLGSGPGTTATAAAPTGSGANGEDVVCRFTNTPKTAAITWDVAFGGARGSDHDQLTAVVHRGSDSGPTASSYTTTGAGSSVTSTATPTTVVATRTAVLTAALAPGSDLTLQQYATTVSCSDTTGATGGLPSGAAFSGSLSITPSAGSDIRCTLTAALRPAGLAVAASLGGARYMDADQFTVGLQDANGTALGSASSATTAGSGSTVTSGTGTTGAVTVPGQASVTITGAPTAHGFAYARVLTCTDANGIATGLPSGEAFTGSRTLVAAAGSAISCTVQATATVAAPAPSGAPAALTVTASAPDSLAVGVAAEYAVAVVNGGGTAAPATTAQRLPAGVAYRGVDGTGWSCAASGAVASGQLVTCSGPTVAAGARSRYALQVLPTADASGDTVVLPVSVSSTGAPADPASCTTTTTGCAIATSRVVGSGIVLGITATGPAALVRGVPAQYVLRVADTGTGAAATATVLDRLPAGVRFVSATGASCTADGRLVTCSVPGPIEPGGSAAVVLQVLPDDIAGSGPLVNLVSVDGDGGTDPATPSSSCSGSACDDVAAPAETPALTLAVAVRGPHDGRLLVGAVVRYAYTITNTGPTGLQHVILSDGTACPATVLAAGASMTCVSGPRTVTQADVDAGRLVRAATAAAAVAGCTGTTCRTASNAVTAASLTRTLAKVALVLTAHLRDADGDGRVDPGEHVRFIGVVTNTGTTVLTGLRVHGGLVDLACPVSRLAPGRSTTCSADLRVRADDIVGGVLSDTAVAKASGASAGAVASPYRSAALAAGTAPSVLASTGSDLVPPLGLAGGLLLLALAGVVVLRRRAVRLRRG